jgi:outer membrane protein
LATSAHASPKTVIVVTDGPVPDERVDLFVTALREVAGSGLEIAEDIPVIAGDWTAVSVEAALEEAYAQDPDLVLAIGIGASSAAVRQDTAPVPTVAPWVLDPVLQDLTDTPNDNIYPVKVHLGLSQHVDSLRAISGAKSIALLVEPTGIERLGIQKAPEDMTLVPLTSAPDAPLAALGDDIDGVIIAPLDRTDEAGREAVAQQLLARELPSFTLAGPDELARGFMMSNTSLGDPIGVARNAALLAVAVLRGRPIDDASWSPAAGGQIALNGETVTKLGVAVPFDVLIQAEVWGDPSDDVVPEDLDTLIDLAIAQSPDLVASQAEVDAARSDLVRSWSQWMPQAGISASAGLVDKRLADASLGQVAPASVGMDASVDQLLYDVMARAAIPIQQRLQAGRVAGFDARSLDVVADVAFAYVNALRADALIDVRRTDLLVLQANLDAARVRVSIGDATDAEEARWQAEIAQARAGLVDAFVARRSAQMSVNQRVGREPGTRFKPEASIADSLLAHFSESVVGRGLDNPESLKRLGDAMVALGLERSPELTQLDLGIDAQEAYLGATKKTYFVPSIGANITGTWNAWRSDAGQGLDLSGLPVGIDLSIPERPELYATAGVSATLPLFEGRARIADQSEATYDLNKLEARRLELEQLLSLRIRTSVLNLEGAYQRVNMAEISVKGADRNLNWASDAYGRGLATQLQLLDARSAVLQANVALTDARFGFLAAIIESQRATATLSHPGNPIDEDAISQKLTELLSEDVQ